jgi:4-amino-4-deoxy-L-arabinose transferase-like glycosyltransferase
VAAAGLRFHALTVKSLWFDEGVSVGIARLDWYNFVRILWRREANMSLYYLLLRGWLHFGHKEAFVRSLSVVFGVAAIPALYLLGRRLFGSRAALAATALLCVNSYHVHYSQEARSYSLTMFLCILSSLSFLRSLRCLDPRLALKEANRVWTSIGLAVSPVIIFVATTGAGPLSWVSRPGLHALWQLADRMTGNGGPLLVLLYAIAVLAAVLSRNIDNRDQTGWNSWRTRFLLYWTFLPVLMVFAISIARPIFVTRYFIFSLPALLLLTACGLARIRAGWLFAVTLLVFLALSLRGTAIYFQERSASPDDNWRAASQYLVNNARSGDALVFHTTMGRLSYEYYRSLQSPTFGPVVLYPYHGPKITYLDFVEKPDYARLGPAIPQYARVWFVISQASTPSGLDKTASALSSLISATDPVVARSDFGGIQVVLYSRPDSR